MYKDSFGELLKKCTNTIINNFIEEGRIILSEDNPEKSIEDFLYSPDFVNAAIKIYDSQANDCAQSIESLMFEYASFLKAEDDKFWAIHNLKWRKAFVASDILYSCILESAEHYAEFVAERYAGTRCYMYFAIQMIHARALQMYQEIMCLVKNGFADGAYARWRSLYELAIVSAFIKKHGESVAEAYLNAADNDNNREWARCASCFSSLSVKQRISINMLQQNCGLDVDAWKHEYELTNQLIHASPTGTVYRLGTPPKSPNALAVGRSDYGIGIAAIHAAQTLAQITLDFFSIFHHADSLLATITFRKWVDKIHEFYKEVEEACKDSEPYFE